MVIYPYLQTFIIISTAHCTLLRISNVNSSSNVTNTKQRLIYRVFSDKNRPYGTHIIRQA